MIRFLTRLCVFLALLWGGAAQAQTFVQQAGNQSAVAVTTLTATFTAIGSGHLLVGSTIWTPGGASCTTNPTESVADNNSVAATVIDTTLDSVNGLCLQTFYFPNVTNGATSITVSLSPAVAQVGIVMQEWSGIKTTSPLDGHIGNVASSGTTVTSTAITTTVNGDLIYGAFGNDNNSNNVTSVNSPYTLRNNETTVNHADESQVQGTAGSVSSTFNCTGGCGGPIAVAAFLAAAASTCPATLALMGVGC